MSETLLEADAAAAPPAAPPARDVRVDRVGYAEDLLKLWAVPMKDALKGRMARDTLTIVEADRYVGRLSGSTSSIVDPVAFFKLYKKGKISERDFVACLRISKEAAEGFMAPPELAKISESKPGASRLTISRRKGIDLPLKEVIDGIVEAMRE